MENILTLYGAKVTINPEATGAWYRQADEWGCECGDCRHFVALAREGRLPALVTDTLAPLGIPPEKATYVCTLSGPEEDGTLYQFNYRLAGEILVPGELPGALARCGHDPYPYGAPNFPTPHFDLEFYLRLPNLPDGGN
ncbi:MAG: hypothetical protein IJC43_04200 [Clostridia bacterium]|nr:hypothetical protein [Clostridia bacterium]